MAKIIGINGGTFDPIHFGHLRPALEVLMALGLEEVKFIPSYNPVHRGQPSVSANHRCEMVSLAIQRQPKFSLDRIEAEREGESYTIDTLLALKEKHTNTTLVLMMGTDAFANFHQWHQWQKILEIVNLVVMKRPSCQKNYSKESKQILKQHKVSKITAGFGQIIELSVTQLDLSATALRGFLQKNEAVDYLMPASVVKYIKQHNLYSE